MKCGTSVAANYRASCRAKSPADFIAKMGIVEEESDETIFWLELIMETKMLPSPRLLNLVGEAEEILAIVVASINTARGGRRRQREGNPQSAIRNPQSQRPND